MGQTSRVMTIDTLNSADALGYFNNIGFTQYMTGKNVFLTGFQPDAENPDESSKQQELSTIKGE